MGLREGAPGPGQLTTSPRRRRSRATPEDLAAQETDAERRLDELEARLGFRFKRRELLREAMTHTSWINERGAAGRDNERLEYLGDAVLELVAGEYLFNRFPTYDEGQLTQIRSSLVSTVALARLGEELRLGEVLRLGRGAAKSGARRLTSLHANAFEALVGATFQDQGYRRAGRIFLSRIGDLSAWTDPNFKGRLQAVAQERLGGPPQYRTVPTGDARSRQYTATVSVEGHGPLGEGRGGTKQAAEQAAARAALDQLMAPQSKRRRRRRATGVAEVAPAPGGGSAAELSGGAPELRPWSPTPVPSPALEGGPQAETASAAPEVVRRRRRRGTRPAEGGPEPEPEVAVAAEESAPSETAPRRPARRRRRGARPADGGPEPEPEVAVAAEESAPSETAPRRPARRRRRGARPGTETPEPVTSSPPAAPEATGTTVRKSPRRRRVASATPTGESPALPATMGGEAMAGPDGSTPAAAPARKTHRGRRGGRRRSGRSDAPAE